VSLLSGFLVGLIIRLPAFLPVNHDDLFSDQDAWEVPATELPFYFDKRGQKERENQLMPHTAPPEAAAAIDLAEQNQKLEAKLAALESRMIAMQSSRPVAQPSSSGARLEQIFELLLQKLSAKQA